MRFGKWLTTCSVGFAFLCIGCDRGGQETADNSNATAMADRTGSGVRDGIFVDTVPAGAQGVAELKKNAVENSDVVIRGRIGGRAQPFVDGAAVFVLTDSSLKSCDQLHGDACKTPWDYCCETPESIAANTLTVQIVGDDGKPLRESVRGTHGLDRLKEIVVAGKIASRDESGGTIVINASRIAVVDQ